MVGKKIYVLHYNERDGKAETVIIKGYPFRKGRTSVAGIVTHIAFVSKTHTHTHTVSLSICGRRARDLCTALSSHWPDSLISQTSAPDLFITPFHASTWALFFTQWFPSTQLICTKKRLHQSKNHTKLHTHMSHDRN